MRFLWEILVPATKKDGTPYSIFYHRTWDKRVRDICGGLSICPVINGQWINHEGILFSEKMIPVRIACSRNEIESVIDMTIDYYEQEAVMAYKVSEEVIIKYADK